MSPEVHEAIVSAVEAEQHRALLTRKVTASDFEVNRFKRRLLRLCENLPEDMVLSELRRELEE